MAKNLNLFLNYRDRQLKKTGAKTSVKKKTVGEIQEPKQVESYRIWEVSCTD